MFWNTWRSKDIYQIPYLSTCIKWAVCRTSAKNTYHMYHYLVIFEVQLFIQNVKMYFIWLRPIFVIFIVILTLRLSCFEIWEKKHDNAFIFKSRKQNKFLRIFVEFIIILYECLSIQSFSCLKSITKLVYADANNFCCTLIFGNSNK